MEGISQQSLPTPRRNVPPGREGGWRRAPQGASTKALAGRRRTLSGGAAGYTHQGDCCTGHAPARAAGRRRTRARLNGASVSGWWVYPERCRRRGLLPSAGHALARAAGRADTLRLRSLAGCQERGPGAWADPRPRCGCVRASSARVRRTAGSPLRLCVRLICACARTVGHTLRLLSFPLAGQGAYNRAPAEAAVPHLRVCGVQQGTR